MLWDKACPGKPRSLNPTPDQKFPETTDHAAFGDGYKFVPVKIISDNIVLKFDFDEYLWSLEKIFSILKKFDYKFSYSIGKVAFGCGIDNSN